MTDAPAACPECGTPLVRMSPDNVPDPDRGGTPEGVPALYCAQCKTIRPGR